MVISDMSLKIPGHLTFIKIYALIHYCKVYLVLSTETVTTSFYAEDNHESDLYLIHQLCGLPSYWKVLLFRAAGGAADGYVTYSGLAVLLKRCVYGLVADKTLSEGGHLAA